MRSKMLKAAVGLALVAFPMQARADGPSLAGFISSTSFLATGATFDVQFLYGLQAQSSTLFYRSSATPTVWTQILATTGNFPLEDVVPTPGRQFNLLASGGAGSLITFALCNGNAYGANGSVLAGGLATCGPPGAFTSGAGSTNVAVTNLATWNALRVTPPGGTSGAACLGAGNVVVASPTGYGCNSIYAQVFGFEDRSLTGAGGTPIADADFGACFPDGIERYVMEKVGLFATVRREDVYTTIVDDEPLFTERSARVNVRRKDYRALQGPNLDAIG